MARRLIATLTGAAVAVGAGSLLLANVFSGEGVGRAALVALYLVFLVATLALLAGGIAWSEQWVDQMAAARASSRRRRRFRTAAGRVARRAGVVTRDGIGVVARASRAGSRRLQRELEGALAPERRQAVLRVLGLEEIDERPAPKPYAVAHARRKAMATSALTRRYNAFEAARSSRSRIERATSR